MKNVAVLGCTGSIGSSTIKILQKYREFFRVGLLANFSKGTELLRLKNLFPEADIYSYATSQDKEFLSRPETYEKFDLVVNGIAGNAGLRPSIAVLEAGKILVTANKESLVCAGNYLNALMEKTGGKIYPVDSEHSAVWQCIEKTDSKSVRSIILTASGGAFRDKTKEELFRVNGRAALAHPNWKMGEKVTVDCATLVNKGMEIIEAKRLFKADNVSAVIHKESIVHGLIETCDGAYIAALSQPDMILPIQYALFYPERKPCDIKRLDLTAVGTLHFEKIDESRFPCYGLCLKAEKTGDVGGTVLSAADEELVKLFLQDKCGFYDVSSGIEKSLDKFATKNERVGIEELSRIDEEVREYILSEYGNNRGTV